MNKRPNLFIAGVAKSGTTILANILAQHPQIFFARQKEPNFFASEELMEEKLYYNTIPISDQQEYLSLFKSAHSHSYLGEASVSYFFYPKSALRIKDFSPEAKVILVLRNPIDRAFSHYLMDKRLGLVQEDFDTIIENHTKYEAHFNQYIRQGNYLDSLVHYQQVFGKNLLVLEWKSDLIYYKEKICDFLQVPNFDVQQAEGNKSLVPRVKVFRQLYANTRVRKAMKTMVPDSLAYQIKKRGFKAQEEKLGKSSLLFLKDYYQNDLTRVKEITGFMLEPQAV